MFTKQDWKLFRTKLADWQEAYMGRLCREYIELLGGDDDLEGFSDELKETVTVFLERQSWDYSDDAQSQVGKVGETQIAEIRGSGPR